MASETATFGGGCFWCVEAAFLEIKGVLSVISGYSGGHTENPDYKSICSGQTGHAEVIRVEFIPTIVSYETLLDIFFAAHDPTTLNRQGNDVGPQYRSIILFESENQRSQAEEKLAELRRQIPIVTELVKLEKFYPAEDYHQNFYANNPNHGYCQVVVRPKVESVKKKFTSKLKANSAE